MLACTSRRRPKSRIAVTNMYGFLGSEGGGDRTFDHVLVFCAIANVYLQSHMAAKFEDNNLLALRRASCTVLWQEKVFVSAVRCEVS